MSFFLSSPPKPSLEPPSDELGDWRPITGVTHSLDVEDLSIMAQERAILGDQIESTQREQIELRKEQDRVRRELETLRSYVLDETPHPQENEKTEEVIRLEETERHLETLEEQERQLEREEITLKERFQQVKSKLASHFGLIEGILSRTKDSETYLAFTRAVRTFSIDWKEFHIFNQTTQANQAVDLEIEELQRERQRLLDLERVARRKEREAERRQRLMELAKSKADKTKWAITKWWNRTTNATADIWEDYVEYPVSDFYHSVTGTVTKGALNTRDTVVGASKKLANRATAWRDVALLRGKELYTRAEERFIIATRSEEEALAYLRQENAAVIDQVKVEIFGNVDFHAVVAPADQPDGDREGIVIDPNKTGGQIAALTPALQEGRNNGQSQEIQTLVRKWNDRNINPISRLALETPAFQPNVEVQISGKKPCWLSQPFSGPKGIPCALMYREKSSGNVETRILYKTESGWIPNASTQSKSPEESDEDELFTGIQRSKKGQINVDPRVSAKLDKMLEQGMAPSSVIGSQFQNIIDAKKEVDHPVDEVLLG